LSEKFLGIIFSFSFFLFMLMVWIRVFYYDGANKWHSIIDKYYENIGAKRSRFFIYYKQFYKVPFLKILITISLLVSVFVLYISFMQ
jgi:hypothetical protein